jgi:hypothetical protein
MFSKRLLQVVIDTVHKLKIIWGMTLGSWMRGVIQLFTENPGIAGKGCGSCVTLNFGNVKWTVFVTGIGVRVVEGIDGCSVCFLSVK